MARVVVTAFEVHPERLFLPGGSVNRWFTARAAQIKAAQKQKAPPTRSRSTWAGRSSTGELRRSIYGRTRRAGHLAVAMEFGATAPHAKYVLGGTAYQGRRYIYSRAGWANKAAVDRIARRTGTGGRAGEGTQGYYMVLPPGAGHTRRFHLRVHGQRANNFLFDGYNKVARRHRALPELRNPHAF